MSHVYNGECSSICDAICDRTGVAPGVVLSGRGRGTLDWISENVGVGNMASFELRVAKLKCHMPILVNVAVYAMQFETGPELPRGLSCGLW